MTKLNVSDNDSYSTDSDCGAIRLTMLRSTSPSCRTITMQDSDSQKQSRLLDWKTDQLQLRQNRQAQPHLNPPLQYSTPFLHSTNNDDCAKESSSKTAHACNLSALQACRQFVKTRLWAACQVSLLTYFTTFVLKMNWSMNQNVKIFFCEQNIQNIPRHWMEVVLQKPSWRHRPPPPRLC